MSEPVTRVSLEFRCKTKGCPWPKDEEIHRPWCLGIPDVPHRADQPTHQHHPKKGMGGNNPISRIVAILCSYCHDRIDNGDWGNGVFRNSDDTGQLYSTWDLHGNKLIEHSLEGSSSVAEPDASERVIGESAEAEASEAPAFIGAQPSRGEAHSSASAPSSLTHEQRINIAASIRADQQQRQWVAGDTANAWVSELGEEAWQYLDDFGYTHMSLSNIMHVCEAIPTPLRHGELTYSHHVVVYKLNKDAIKAELHEASRFAYSVREFRAQVHGEPPRAKKKWTVDNLQLEANIWCQPGGEPLRQVLLFLAFLEAQDG